MKDEYSPRDMNLDQSMMMYNSELTGPSLKQLEKIKAIKQIQQESEQLTSQVN